MNNAGNSAFAWCEIRRHFQTRPAFEADRANEEKIISAVLPLTKITTSNKKCALTASSRFEYVHKLFSACLFINYWYHVESKTKNILENLEK